MLFSALVYLSNILFIGEKMPFELFFIYDSHCPWSYKTTDLVENILIAYPKAKLHLFHCNYFDGEQTISNETINSVKKQTGSAFSNEYLNNLSETVNSTLVANLMAWTQNKVAKQAFPLLKQLQKMHFELGLSLTEPDMLTPAIESLKLSPPQKIMTNKKLSKEAEFSLQDISELQEIMGTEAIPALLVAIDDNLTLLNHNFYLEQPEKIVEAIELELTQ